jgi:hypothetical protein
VIVSWVENVSEAEEVEFTVHVVHVIVEIFTDDHHCSNILLDDILDDICHPLRSSLSPLGTALLPGSR